MRIHDRRLIAVALSLVAFAACSSDISSSTAVRIEPGSVSTASKDAAPKVKTKVKPLHRKSKLESAITVSRTIGASGGSLSIPAAGVTVTVPAGALLVPTEISMTALEGDAVAYEFAPHGLVFLKPLTLSQSLTGTKEKGSKGSASPDPVELGYFGLSSQIGSLVAEVEDIRGGTETADTFTSQIWHFSGYMVSCSRR